MKLIPQSEIEKAALNNSIQHYIMAYSDELHEYSKIDFEAGVEFAESKFEELAIEFAHYLGIETDGSLVAQFIKDRNEKN